MNNLTLPEPTQPYKQPPQSNWFDIRRRGVWILAFFVAFIILMALAAAIPVNPTDARTTTEELQNQLKYIATVDLIFGHNFFLTLIMLIPFIGPIFGGISAFSTGIVIADIAFVNNVNAELLLASLFTAPHTWLELFAYALAMSQSVFVSIAIVRGRFRQELVRTCVIMAICALTLVVAAFFEVILIALRSG